MTRNQLAKARELHERGFSLSEIAKRVNVVKSTVYWALKTGELPPQKPRFAVGDLVEYKQCGGRGQGSTSKAGHGEVLAIDGKRLVIDCVFYGQVTVYEGNAQWVPRQEEITRMASAIREGWDEGQWERQSPFQPAVMELRRA